MGGMLNEEIINIPQLDVDPSKDSTSMYPPAIIKLLDAIEANYKKPCKEMEKLLKTAELQCKLRATAEQNRVQAAQLKAKAVVSLRRTTRPGLGVRRRRRRREEERGRHEERLGQEGGQ
jgi:hypothetical protein